MSVTTGISTIAIKDLIAANKLAVNMHHALSVQSQNPGQMLKVDPNTLLIAHSYQRELNTRHAMTIAEGFEHYNMKPATGFRDTETGKILITDGQHTVTAAALCGLKEVPVYVHDLPEGIDAEEALAMQSKQFLSINQSNKPVNLFTIHKNKLIQKEPGYVALQAMCDRVGVTPCLAHNNAPGAVSHIKNLNTAWFQIGEKDTEEALKYMRKYFPRETIHGAMLVGFALFIQKMNKYAGRANATWDPVILTNALTSNGTKGFKEIYEDLHELNRNIGRYGASATTQQWVAGMIKETYNSFIRDNSLTQTQLGQYC